MAEEITISRQELYNLVWAKPVVQIAKEFGISDVAIAKICKKMNIPKPGLGYWAKKEFGKKTKMIPLPERRVGDVESYTIRKSVEPYFKPETDSIRKYREFEERSENKIMVKSSLRNPHPLVQEARMKLSNPYIDRYKKCSGRGDCLDISVSKDNIRRSLLIMDALLKGLTKRGYAVTLSKFGENKTVTTVNVDGEKFWISLQEASKTIPIENSKRDDGWYSSSRNYDYAPTGKLTLQITNFYHGSKSVSDGKTQRVEDKLNSFILMLVKAGEYDKNWRMEREIERKEAEEKEQMEREIQLAKEREQQRVKELFDNAATWNKCVLARDYITAVKCHADEEANEGDLDSWVLWASQQVDRVESRLWHPSISKL